MYYFKFGFFRWCGLVLIFIFYLSCIYIHTVHRDIAFCRFVFILLVLKEVLHFFFIPQLGRELREEIKRHTKKAIIFQEQFITFTTVITLVLFNKVAYKRDNKWFGCFDIAGQQFVFVRKIIIIEIRAARTESLLG